MARHVRIEYPGAIYHVMSRGDRREDIGSLLFFFGMPDKSCPAGVLTLNSRPRCNPLTSDPCQNQLALKNIMLG